jgi:hypothetical protein
MDLSISTVHARDGAGRADGCGSRRREGEASEDHGAAILAPYKQKGTA